MTKREAADLLGVSLRAINRYTSAGKLQVTYQKLATGQQVGVYDDAQLQAFKRQRQEPIPTFRYAPKFKIAAHVRIKVGYIYAISWDIPECPIKIGMTMFPQNRISDLGTASPFPIITYGVWEVPEHDMRVHEAAIHQHLSLHRLRGEWFERSAALNFLDEYIKQL